MTPEEVFLQELGSEYPFTFEGHFDVVEREYTLTAYREDGTIFHDAVIGYRRIENSLTFMEKIADFKDDLDTLMGKKDNTYRKIPVEIQAVQYEEGMEDGILYHVAMFGLFTKEECIDAGFTPDFENGKLRYILTTRGKEFLSPGDWIVTDVDGDRHAYKPDVFEKNYEKVINDGC